MRQKSGIHACLRRARWRLRAGRDGVGCDESKAHRASGWELAGGRRRAFRFAVAFRGVRLTVADHFGREILDSDGKPIVRAKRCLEHEDIMPGEQHGVYNHRGHNHPANPNPSLHVRRRSKYRESVLPCVSDTATGFELRMHIRCIVGCICNILR